MIIAVNFPIQAIGKKKPEKIKASLTKLNYYNFASCCINCYSIMYSVFLFRYKFIIYYIALLTQVLQLSELFLNLLYPTKQENKNLNVVIATSKLMTRLN